MTLIIVVSEENGKVSVAQGGVLEPGSNEGRTSREADLYTEQKAGEQEFPAAYMERKE